VARRRLRSQRDIVAQARSLQGAVREALSARVETGDAAWSGEGAGTLLWTLGLLELPPYDEPFDGEAVARASFEGGTLREREEIELESEAARLWHWRARTAALERGGRAELPGRYASFDQLVAATAMRGFEAGLLPPPLRGDFPAFGKIYRHLSPEQLTEAHSIAAERHRALAWVRSAGRDWNDVPLDT
jgi:hypothetical protein